MNKKTNPLLNLNLIKVMEMFKQMDCELYREETKYNNNVI